MDDTVFELTRVRLRHYRSIADADVELGRLLLLVGPNGSGKSNFLDALEFVSDSLRTGLGEAIRSRGGIYGVAHRSTTPSRFSIDLEFRWPGAAGNYGFEVSSARPPEFRVDREWCRVDPTDDSPAHGAYFETDKADAVVSSEALMPPRSVDRLFLPVASSLVPFRQVADGLAAINVVNLNPDTMRGLNSPEPGARIRRDGSNAASVLRQLDEAADSALRARIDDYLGAIVPGLHGVSHTDFGGLESLSFVQDQPGASPWTFRAQSVSDGTLRAAGLLIALFAQSGRVQGPVGIEEPESGLHPAAAAVLLDALRDASERRQVIVTSHSPDLLDHNDFTLDEIRAVRSVDGKTIIGPLDAAGSLALREELYTPGELLRRDQLLPETDRTA